MSPLHIENLSTAAASASKRTATTGLSGEAGDAVAFDEQLRLAVKPEETKAARAHSEDASPAGSPQKAEKPQRDDKRFDEADAESDVKHDAQTEVETGDPQATPSSQQASQDIEDAINCETGVAETAAEQTSLPQSVARDTADQSRATKPDVKAADTAQRSGLSLQTAVAHQDDAAETRPASAVATDAQRAADGDSQEHCMDIGPESLSQNAGTSKQASIVSVTDDQTALEQETPGQPPTNAQRQIDAAGSGDAAAPATVADSAAASQEQSGSAEEEVAGNAHTETTAVLREEETSAAKQSAAKADTIHNDPLQTPAVETHPAKATPRLQTVSGGSEPHPAVPSGLDGDASGSVDRVRFVQRAAQAFAAAGRDGSTLRIRLHPAELGSLRLEVAVRDGTVTARLETETQEAKHVLLESLPALRERLEQQNIKIERFDVDYSGGHNDQPSQNAADKNHPQDRLPQGSYGSPADDDTQSGSESGGESPQPRRLGQTAQLDVVA